MSDTGRALSQAEIDSVFKQATGREIEKVPKAAATAVADPPPAAAPPVKVVAAQASQAAPTVVTSNAPSPEPAPAPAPAPAPTPAPDVPPVAAAAPPAPDPLAPEPAAPTPPQPLPPVMAAPAAPAATVSPMIVESIQALTQSIGEITQRLSRLEQGLAQVKQQVSMSDESSDDYFALNQAVKTQRQGLKKVQQRIQHIANDLSDTPGYAAHDRFTCDSCGEQGLVAIPVKCTSCGTQGWYGWWPDKPNNRR